MQDRYSSPEEQTTDLAQVFLIPKEWMRKLFQLYVQIYQESMLIPVEFIKGHLILIIPPKD